MKFKLTALAICASALLAGCSQAGGAGDQPAARGWGPGWGGPPTAMMGGWGPGYGPGSMMGACGGPGMMGPGMMGPRGWGWLPNDLTPDQREKIAAIQRDMHAKQWPLMAQMHDLMGSGSAGDEATQRANYDKLAAVQKQMFENMLDARQRMQAVLTPEQRSR